MTNSMQSGELIYVFGRGDRYRAARESLHLSQDAFGKLIGYSRGTVAKVEAGRTDVHPNTFILWRQATGFSERWLDFGEVPEGAHMIGSTHMGEYAYSADQAA